MARGLPLIASKRGGISESARSYRHASLYEPDQLQALPDLMRGALRSHRQGGENPHAGNPQTTGENSELYYDRLARILSLAANRHGDPAQLEANG